MDRTENIKILIEKYLNNEASDAERLQILQALRSDIALNGWLKRQIEATSNTMDSNLKKSIYERIWDEISENSEKELPINKRHNFRWVISIAAAACVLAAVIGFALHYAGKPSYESKPLSIYNTTGNRSCITLPDGTSVWLNSLSQISYSYDSEKNRRVAKLSGEAFFEVAHDQQHPFFVEAGGVKVECKGTKFNVNAYSEDEYVEVVLAEGLVSVSSDHESVDLYPNQMAQYIKKTNRLSKKEVESQNYCDWVNGYLYFDNQRFADIVKTISRTYGVTVNIYSAKLKNDRFTGSIHQSDIKDVLNVLSSASGATYRIENDSIINLYKK
jgi:ferric-dicitrate binding protein FerR (iron transport regulator)